MTICSWNRESIFGDIIDEEMRLNEYGQIVAECWNAILDHFNHVELDESVFMPNHIHGIILIFDDNCRGEVSSPSLKSNKTIQKGGVTPPLQKHTLGQIIAYFKYHATKCINQIRNTPGIPIWHRNYYEHVIRNEDELNRIREYILNNPLKWAEDENNPVNIKMNYVGAGPRACPKNDECIRKGEH